MFVNFLSSEEKKSLFQLILAIARADGDISIKEIDYLSAYADEYNIDFSPNMESNLEQVCSQLRSFKSKVVAIQEIVKIALVDGHYDEAEKRGALMIANLLNYQQKSFRKLKIGLLKGRNGC